MKNIFYFILGICLIVLTSATTVSVMTIKPATPISTVVFYEYSPQVIPKKINPYLKKGYVVKAVYGDRFQIVVLEKY
jgi:hypothetical protein